MLLTTDEYRDELKNNIALAKNEIILISAFITEEALNWLIELIQNPVRGVIVCRFRKKDILFGATDLEIFNIAQKLNWEIKIDLQLHSKAIIIDKNTVFVSSANLTSRGLGLINQYNIEFGTKFNATENDLQKINSYLESTTQLTPELFDEMKEDIESTDITKNSFDEEWQDIILNKLYQKIEYIWLNETILCAPNELLRPNLNDEKILHDLNLLRLDFDDITENKLKESFAKTKEYNWFINVLKKYHNINFGKITHELHNSLFDEPPPYRSVVKDIVANLIAWLQFMNLDSIKFTQHNKTISMQYLEK